MAAQDVSAERTEPVDRTGDRGGSIGMVLAVALLLVGSVVAFLFIGRANAQPYVLALAVAARGDRRVRACSPAPPASCGSPGARRATPFLDALADSASDGIVVTDQNRRVVYANAAYLHAGRRGRCRRRAAGRARLRRRSAGVGGDLPPRQGGARGPAAAGRGAGAGRARAARRAGCASACGRCSESGPYARWTAWTISRRHARPRPAGERVPGTAARDRLSRSRAGRLLLGRCRRARSATSTRRSRAGSTTTWRRSARAG